MIALFSFEGSAYTFTQDYQRGVYWKNFPVNMTRFAVDESEGELLQTVVDEAVEEWESQTGKEIWDIAPVVIGNSSSGNFIRWSYNFSEETGFDATRTLAVTIRYNNGSVFERVVIILNAQIGYLKNNFGGALKKTILHELGHTVGLDHSTEQSIMGASLSAISTLQSDDIQGMNALLDDTHNKQQTGFVAQQTEKSESNKIAACGTVENISSGGSSGGIHFLQSLIMGLLLAIFARILKRRDSYQSILLK